eukprot:9485037-Pyramimonas_sp.AAC.1
MQAADWNLNAGGTHGFVGGERDVVVDRLREASRRDRLRRARPPAGVEVHHGRRGGVEKGSGLDVDVEEAAGVPGEAEAVLPHAAAASRLKTTRADPAKTSAAAD